MRNTRPEDHDGIIETCRLVYPASLPWGEDQLLSHLEVYREGQFVAVEEDTGRILGMAASLVILWDDYASDMNWKAFTAEGSFENHDPARGRTLYAAEVMVRPGQQGRGIGKKLYAARFELVKRQRLLRIRAGARLRGYHRHAKSMTAEEYVLAVLSGKVADPTLVFQLKQGFDVMRVVPDYLFSDPDSLGYAALIEWLNPQVATPEDAVGRDPRFRSPARGEGFWHRHARDV